MNDQAKSVVARSLLAVGGVLGLAVVLPIVYYAFLSALGLLGVLIAGGIGVAMIKVFPLLGQKLENWVLGARKREAQANPIEQIENNVRRKTEQLNAFRIGLVDIGSQIGTLENSLNAYAKRDPNDDLTEQRDALAKMKQYYAMKKQAYAQAEVALDDYKKAVERAKFKFGFGTAAQGIAKAMNANDANALVQNMLSDEAFKAVDLRFNSAFAALDVDSVELSDAKQISFGRGVMIDVNAIHIPTAEQITLEVKR